MSRIPTWLLVSLYVVTILLAAVWVPSLTVLLTYGLATWSGGCLFVLTLQRLLR